jgi:hypothetical protein
MKVVYSRTFNLGNYESERIELDMEVDGEEQVEAAFMSLKVRVQQLHRLAGSYEFLTHQGVDYFRAGGQTICEDCGEEYNNHGLANEVVDASGTPWLTRLCSGVLVKL